MSYTSENIQTLHFPDNVRVSPGVYIGAVDSDGYWLILREGLDNGLDEFLAGRNSGVALVEDKDGSFWIYDQGAGIPQGTKTITVNLNGKQIKSEMPTMQAVFSELHTSGKYHSDAYKTSVGSHGLGVKASNALSEFFNVTTCYQGKWYSIGFKKGILTEPVTQCKAPIFRGKTLSRGTLIHLKHDATIFKKDKNLDLNKAKSWAEITSYLNPGFTALIIDKSGNQYKYRSKEGAKEFVNKILSDLKAEAESTFFEFKNELADVVVSFSNAEGNNIRGYTNGLYNSDGGKHVDSVANALFNACKPYSKSRQTVSAYDFKEGLVGIVNMHLHKAEFSSQDKLKLTDSRAGADFQKMLETAAVAFFKKNKALAQKLCEKASKLSELRNQFKASKKMISAINAAKKKGMPAKYAPYDSRSKLEDRELLIVEGLSAAGGLRQVRASNQALYPIKGKITNLIKNKDKGLESEEVINILSAIGYDPKSENPMSKLQVGRVICLADADDDGCFDMLQRVLLCNGQSKTFAALNEQWKKDHKPIWVWSMDSSGNIHPAQAYEPTIRCYRKKEAHVYLDNGDKIVCTLNHPFAVNYANSDKSYIDEHGIRYVKAKHLKPGDSIMSAYFEDAKIAWNGTAKYKHFVQSNGKLRALHSIVAEDTYPEQYTLYKKANIQAKKNHNMKMLQNIHHKDGNKMNNDPSNLEFLSAIDHWKHHGKEWCDSYNGSEKHKQDLADFYSSDRGQQFIEEARARRVQYNNSEQNRESIVAINKREDVKLLQRVGKYARAALKLKALGLTANKDGFNKSYCIAGNTLRCFYTDFILEHFELISNRIATLSNSEGLASSLHSYIVDDPICINPCIQLAQKLIREDRFSLEEYDQEIAKDIKGTLAKSSVLTKYLHNKYKLSIEEYAKSTMVNHKVVKVEIKEFNEPKPFYCLTVPKYGNFLLADKNGNGICSSNCHINTLLLSLFYKVLPEMFEKGMIYVADMPEFYTTYKNTIITGQSISEIKTKLLELGHKPTANDTYYHLKGWGELENSLMKVLAVDKATRKLIRIKPITDHDNITFVRIMNEDVAYRRQMLGLSDDV